MASAYSSEPRVLFNGRHGYYIVKETDYGRRFWAAKHGEWVGAGVGNWRTRSRFRTIGAAELEIKRIKLHPAPSVPKKAVAKA
jgi:hypothetical protein